MNKILTAVFLLWATIQAQAGLINEEFSEDFSRNNSNRVGNTWYEFNESADDVKVLNGALRMRDNAEGIIDAGVYRKFELGVSGLTLSFDWMPLIDSASNDFLNVSWTSACSEHSCQWENLFSANLGANDEAWINSQVVLPELVGLDDFYLLFWVDLSERQQGYGHDHDEEHDEDEDEDNADNKGVWLDNIYLITVSEPAIAPALFSLESPVAIPAPSSLLLVLAGMLGFTASKKLSKKA